MKKHPAARSVCVCVGGGSLNVFFFGIVSFLTDVSSEMIFTLVPASLITGWLWQAFSPEAPFFFGAGMAAIATIGMLVLIRERTYRKP
jgi:hypothetical protein